MLTRGGIFIRNPRLVFADGEEEPGGGNDQESTPTFPANTPVKDMTPEQQVAFHEAKARKLEDKLKGFGGLTPKQIAELQTENASLKSATQTAEEKALEEAREAGRAEVRNLLAEERIKNALEKALTGRIPDAIALLELDRTQFVKDGTADTDAIKAWAEAHSTEPSPQKKNPALGQGRERGTDGPSKGADAGRELFATKRKSK